MLSTVEKVYERPKIIIEHSASKVRRKNTDAAERLAAGEQLLVCDHYSTGAQILLRLRMLLPPLKSDVDYDERQERERAFREAVAGSQGFTRDVQSWVAAVCDIDALS